MKCSSIFLTSLISPLTKCLSFVHFNEMSWAVLLQENDVTWPGGTGTSGHCKLGSCPKLMALPLTSQSQPSFDISRILGFMTLFIFSMCANTDRTRMQINLIILQTINKLSL